MFLLCDSGNALVFLLVIMYIGKLLKLLWVDFCMKDGSMLYDCAKRVESSLEKTCF